MTKEDRTSEDTIELHPRHKVYWSVNGTVPYNLDAYYEAALQGISNGKLKLCLGVSSEYGDQSYYTAFTKFSIYILTGKVEWV